MLLEVTGGSDDGYANRPTERQSDHIFLNTLSHSNANVEPSFDDVHVALIIRQLHVDIRIGLQEPGQQRLEDHGSRDSRCVDAQDARWPPLKLMKLLPGFQH